MLQRTIFEDEHNWFRESVQTFVKRELAPRSEAIRENRLIDRDIWLKAGEAGFLGLGIDEEFGGNGVRDFRFNTVFTEETSRLGAAYGSSFGIHTDVCVPYITDLGTQEQKERWLPIAPQPTS